MGRRAECVMLNKGPYIRETLRRFVATMYVDISQVRHGGKA